MLNDVEEIKADLVARGVNLNGPCGAFEITKRVAWKLRDRGAGLLVKSSGNNCQGYSTDYVVFRGGPAYDILGDGGGSNTPQWNLDTDPGLISRWAAPIDPGDEITPPVAPIEPPVTIPDRFDEVLAALEGLRVQADQNTEKIQTQLNHIVTDAEKTLKALPVDSIFKLLGGK